MKLSAIILHSSLSLFPFLAPSLAYYDDNNPYLTENFDPADANPVRSIKCVGPLPPWRLPRFPTWDPNNFTLQELCAKPQYGGRAVGQHLSAFCVDFHEHLVGFDFSTGASMAWQLTNPRLMLYCRTRCFCNFNREWALSRPEGEMPYRSGTIFHPQWTTYQVTVRAYDGFDQIPANQRGLTEDDVVSTEVFTAGQLAIDWNEAIPSTHHADPLPHSYPISLDPKNQVRCAGPFPPWPALAPFSWDHFNSLQELCAIQLAGGNYEANAGTYCLRLGNGRSIVWFTDEMTPRLDWTWNNFRYSVALRVHCHMYCRCDNEEPASINSTWPFLPHAAVFTNKASGSETNGSVVVKPWVRDDPLKEAIVIIPAITLGVPPAVGTCGPDGRGFCNEPWPSHLLGPTPTAPPGVAPAPSTLPGPLDDVGAVLPEGGTAYTFQAPPRSASEVPQHHRPPRPRPSTPAGDDWTRKAQQCAVQNQQKPCTCSGSCSAVSQGCAWHHLGLCKCTARPFWQGNSFSFLGHCAAVVSGAGHHGGKVRRDSEGMGSNGGSGTRPDGNNHTVLNVTVPGGGMGLLDAVTLQRLACPCNGSYVSYACCDSVDGIVHEPREKHLGSLMLPGQVVLKDGHDRPDDAAPFDVTKISEQA
ncbi:MAG: hypothetical protein M1817_000294 [Caeruleum heppii]|nr:MAG: hypothetical protein M1817_000294 [Caeruleum heppii]